MMMATMMATLTAPFRWLHSQPDFIEAVGIFRKLECFQHTYERAATAAKSYAGWQSKQSWLLDSMVNNDQLTDWEFAEAGRHIAHPLESALALDGDNAKAALWLFQQGADAILRREETAATIRDASKRLLDPLSRHMRQWQLPNAALVASEFRFATCEALVCAMEYTDVTLAECFLHGFQPVFECPDSGAWKPQEKAATKEFNRANNDAWTTELSSRLEQRSRKATGAHMETVWAVWGKTQKEKEKGYVIGPFSRSQLDHTNEFGWGNWRPIGRNGIWQNGKCRCVDDARVSGHNDATTTHETIVCSGPDFPARAACEFAKLHGEPVMMWCGMEDIEAAYRRIPNANPGYTVVALWDPVELKVVYYKLPGFNFGLVSAVISFNRFPRFCCAAIRRFFGITCDHYVDDYCVAEPSYAGKSGQVGLNFIHELLHFALAPDKHVAMGPENVFLGVCTNFAHIVQEGIVVLKMRDEMMKIVTGDFESVVRDGKLTRGHASRLRGQCQFIGNAIFGRVGRAPMQALANRQYQRSPDTSVEGELLEALLLIIHLLKVLPARRIKVLPKSRRKALLVWSDAMWEVKETGKRRQVAKIRLGQFKAQLGFVAYDPEKDKYYHASLVVGMEIISKFVPGKATYIGQLEALAAAAVYASLRDSDVVDRDILRDRYVLHWVDNTSAVAGLIKGYSSKSDTGRVLNALQFMLASLSCVPWFAYVPSEQNVADAPSRGEFGDLRKRGSIEVTMRLPEFSSWLSPSVAGAKSKRGSRGKKRKG